MSRIGRLPVTIPAGVNVTVDDNNLVTVKGPNGTLTQQVDSCITVSIDGDTLTCTRANEQKKVKAMHGLYRVLINNMVIGATKDFTKTLVIKGVGYKAQKVGNKIVMNIGFSHQVEVEETENVKLNCPTATEIVASGNDKQLVGAMAAKIRAIKPVEPYHGYGIKYSDEVIILKQGKTSGKK